MQQERRITGSLTASLVNGRNTLRLVAVQFLVIALLVAAMAVAGYSGASAPAAGPALPAATYDQVETADSDL